MSGAKQLLIVGEYDSFLLDDSHQDVFIVGSNIGADFSITANKLIKEEHASFSRRGKSWGIEPINGKVLIEGENINKWEAIGINDSIELEDLVFIVQEAVNSHKTPLPPPPIYTPTPPPIIFTPPSPTPIPPLGPSSPAPLPFASRGSYASYLASLPRGWNNPTVIGEVEYVDVSEREENTNCFLVLIKFLIGIILIFLKPFMVIMSLFGGRNEIRNRTKIYRIRLEIGGRFQEVTVRGDFDGAGVNMGDIISVWGVEKRGVIEMRRGYNHTVNAQIQIRK
jgi:hypothetical protein